jgi:nitroreductase
MQTLEAIKTRRAVRGWSEKDVAQDTLQQVLEAGRYAPSPLNSQPWHFTVIRNADTINKLMEHANHGSFLTQAKVVIVVTVLKQAKVDEWLAEHEQHIYSGVCAMENMWLAAWDMGLGACWVTVDEKTTRGLLGLPKNHKLLGSLALGYATIPVKPHTDQDRKPLSDMVSYENFGSSAD